MNFSSARVLTGLLILAVSQSVYASSCMPNIKGTAQLCYYKSSDGRCQQYGPDCQVEKKAVTTAKLTEPSTLKLDTLQKKSGQ
jgi:hypothetical protein